MIENPETEKGVILRERSSDWQGKTEGSTHRANVPRRGVAAVPAPQRPARGLGMNQIQRLALALALDREVGV
jgi:hypothetical protein